MLIEAVTVCVGYGDFLAETARYNAGMFSRWLIVTSERDEETREVCRKHSLETLLTRDHEREGAFGKGRVIERGLQHLSAGAWRVHLDADIVLPSRFSHLLRAAHLDERKIYGCDRINVRSWDAWQKLRASNWQNHSYHCRVAPPKGAEMGSRWADRFGGYVPIGYFQMWNAAADEWRGVRVKPYPIHHNSACRTDVQHALQWDRRDRELIPELLVVHLESEQSKLGANWCGRTTKRFGPPRHHKHHCDNPYGD